MARKKVAKKWFVSMAMGWSIGVAKAKDLMEALEGSGVAQKNYIDAMRQHDIVFRQADTFNVQNIDINGTRAPFDGAPAFQFAFKRQANLQ